MSNNKNTFWSELKRRNIFRVATVYLIVGWLIIQIADATFEPLQLPSWSLTLLIVFLVVGLGIALISAWAYEMSPQGMIRTTSLQAKENPYSTRKKKPFTSNLIIGILLIGVIGQFVYFKFLASAPGDLTITSDNKSIAVLYFDNMSGDAEQEYFSDGITEEIITHLTKVKDIRVISRTSVRTYKGQAINIKEIAKELNVSAILEGSVRKSGNTIRVTAQLIDAATDEHIWVETYDRQLADIFQIQSDIARLIAEKFSVEVPLQIGHIPTTNIQAYDNFQKGKHFTYKYWNDQSEDNFNKAKLFY